MDVEVKIKGNYAGGENVGGLWIDKIMGMKFLQFVDISQVEGVDEDEWVFILLKVSEVVFFFFSKENISLW